MISLRDFPSAVRFEAYAIVLSSYAIRLIAIWQRAQFAWRLPPRLSLWRAVLPLDAGIGETPHNEAKAASLLILSRLSPAATTSAAAGDVPQHWIPSKTGTFASRSSLIRSSHISTCSRAFFQILAMPAPPLPTRSPACISWQTTALDPSRHQNHGTSDVAALGRQ